MSTKRKLIGELQSSPKKKRVFIELKEREAAKSDEIRDAKLGCQFVYWEESTILRSLGLVRPFRPVLWLVCKISLT